MVYKFSPYLALLLLGCCLCLRSYATEPPAQEKLILYYEDRIPYIVPVMGEGLIGFIASRVTNVLDEAGIRYEWSLLPFHIQLEMLKRNQKPACGVGMFKTSPREDYMLYSKPIYQDRPQLIFANTQSDFSQYTSIKSLLADKQKRLLVKKGYSHGNHLERMIKAENPTRYVSSKRNAGTYKEVLQGKADYLIAIPEEQEMLVKLMDLNPNQYQVIRFPDMPNGELRHIACSLNVGQATMDKINQAIDKLSVNWQKNH